VITIYHEGNPLYIGTEGGGICETNAQDFASARRVID